MSKNWLMNHYPTTIVRDRYCGTYSGAEWLAFPLDHMPEGVAGDDLECAEFWKGYWGLVGKGKTPSDALLDLEAAVAWEVINLSMED